MVTRADAQSQHRTAAPSLSTTLGGAYTGNRVGARPGADTQQLGHKPLLALDHTIGSYQAVLAWAVTPPGVRALG